jgi:2-enoate reductase
MEEGLWITGELEKMGIDAHHVDAGCKENSWWPHPPMYQPLGCMLDISEKVRRISAKPVVAVGRLDRPVIAEKALTDGKADFIALGRGLLADPEWVNKVSNNRIETIIPCIGCHDGCLGAMLHQRPIGCSVNPSCGHEVEWLVTPLKRKKTMLVVGGGPAGIEASRLGIERGFSVTLWEKDSRIGGNLWAAGRPDFKQDIRDYIVYLDGLVRSLPIALQTNKNATPDDLLQQEADHIVIATGAHMGGSLLAAMENMPLISAYDVMNGTSIEGNRIVIMGPGVIGCETALYLARMGKNVSLTMTFPDEELATNLEIRANRDMLLEMMREAGVVVMSHTVPKAIQKGMVIAKSADQELMIPADTVVYAGLMVPNTDLMEPLGKRRSGIIKIGDCLQPGRIIDAVWGAFQAIRNIES